MTNLYDGELLDLLRGTPFEDDPETVCLSYALKKGIQSIIDAASQSQVTAMVDLLPEHILDVLAVEMGIAWYEPDSDIDVKRNLIKSATNVHMIIGTKEAIQQVVRDYYGDSEVLDWYEYGGSPGHFKVNVLTEEMHITVPERFIEVLKKIKRQSAIMDGIDFVWTTYLNKHVGVGTKQTLFAAEIWEEEEE